MLPRRWLHVSMIRGAPIWSPHRLDEMIGFRMCMIAAGYEDANDASRLRTDPLFKPNLNT